MYSTKYAPVLFLVWLSMWDLSFGQRSAGQDGDTGGRSSSSLRREFEGLEQLLRDVEKTNPSAAARAKRQLSSSLRAIRKWVTSFRKETKKSLDKDGPKYNAEVHTSRATP